MQSKGLVALLLALTVASGCSEEPARPEVGPAAALVDGEGLWTPLLSPQASDFAGALDRLASADRAALRAVRYQTADSPSSTEVRLNGLAFSLCDSEWTRPLFERIASELENAGAARRRSVYLGLDALLAGVMESTADAPADAPYMCACLLRIVALREAMKTYDVPQEASGVQTAIDALEEIRRTRQRTANVP